jgi:acetyl-CoA synthetase
MDWKIKDLDEYEAAWRKAKDAPDEFWGDIAKSFQWKKSWEEVQSGSFAQANIKWFGGGELNITENCLDRHLADRGDKQALLFIPNDPQQKEKSYTYKELHGEVCKAANMLKELGIEKGDRVCIYMSMVPELLISLLACARIGAIHSVVFGGFSAKALAGRIEDATCKLLITNDNGYRGDKIIPLKDIADEALRMDECKSVEKVLVHQIGDYTPNMKEGRDFDWHSAIEKQPLVCEATTMKSEDTLFILYTSGSTGKPKGIEHTTAGYMVWAAYTFANVFQVEEKDLYWCSADIGWITGHTYITYGPLLNGATTVMFEGVPTWPDASRFWQEIERFGITHFYTAPTAIRALMAKGDDFVTKHKMPSLKVLGSVGEPINYEAWEWYHEKVGKKNCPIVDTWWQTETGGILISPLAGITKLKPCHATKPLPGVIPAIVDSEGNIIEETKCEGNLCITRPWPGVVRTIWNDHDRYIQTYLSSYKGMYFTGDGCRRDEEGFYRITGRVDDVINVSGHRIGTAEVEDAIDLHEHVVEAAVVGFPHDIKGEGIYAYMITSGEVNEEQIRKEILELVTKEIGPIAKPDIIHIVEGLPKTRSGKIMRRILRKIAANEHNFGDTSTLLDPSVVDKIIATK